MRSRRGRYDAVLMDVTLPDIDGVEATRRIRALGGGAGHVPIVGVSGRGNAAEEARARGGGNGRLSDEAAEPERAHAGARLGGAAAVARQADQSGDATAVSTGPRRGPNRTDS